MSKWLVTYKLKLNDQSTRTSYASGYRKADTMEWFAVQWGVHVLDAKWLEKI
ncbi:MAG: hypothetical protein J6B01_04955 [Ruminococcus sp.]|nr:hypothetical protein [Ruminococcus sp.]MBO5319140.1 hypothetical protein [Ruminococcus sp.]